MEEIPISDYLIVDERDEFMLSPFSDDTPSLKTAHFLKSSSSSNSNPIDDLPLLYNICSLPNEQPLKKNKNIHFPGWRRAPSTWIEWLKHLHDTYQSVWKQVGIYEAVMNCSYEIKRDEDFLYGVVEKWNPKTNTFIFPWGEVTITLEDVMVLGGFPVLGDSVFHPLGDGESKKIEMKLIQARKETGLTKARKACRNAWIKMIMKTGCEFEHEAFLVSWLSIFVLQNSDLIRKLAFPVAIHLAKGRKIALAPAVLASIYRDLSLFKVKMEANDSEVGEIINGEMNLKLWSQFQLVQIWGWERFTNFQPKPNVLEPSDDSRPGPRFALWHRTKSLGIENVRIALNQDLKGQFFQWRPYVLTKSNWTPKFYSEEAKWIVIANDLEMDEEWFSFANCLRDSQLVGLDCNEHYFPHRVGRQFGLDQDLPFPDVVPRQNAGNNYNKPIGNLKMYIPSKLYKGEVTARYFKWWNKSILGKEISMVTSPNKLKEMKMIAEIKIEDINDDLPPNHTSMKFILKKGKEMNMDSERKIADLPPPPGFPPKSLLPTISLSKTDMGPPPPPGFPPKGTIFNEPNVDQSASSSTRAANQSAFSTKQDLVLKPMEPSMDIEANSESIKGDSGKGEEEIEEASRMGNVNEKEGNRYSKEIGIIAMELEERIRRLEEGAVELKAAAILRKRSQRERESRSTSSSFHQDWTA